MNKEPDCMLHISLNKSRSITWLVGLGFRKSWFSHSGSDSSCWKNCMSSIAGLSLFFFNVVVVFFGIKMALEML